MGKALDSLKSRFKNKAHGRSLRAPPQSSWKIRSQIVLGGCDKRGRMWYVVFLGASYNFPGKGITDTSSHASV